MRRNEKNIYDTNCYIEYHPVYESQITMIKTKLQENIIYTNQDVCFDKFIDELKIFENTKLISDKVRHVYGNTLLIMLDKQQDDNKIIKICEELSHYFLDLPMYAVKTSRGKAHYIYMYLGERYYFPNGKDFSEEYKSDIYKDSKTGRMCKKDHENAILAHAKGDIKKTVNAKFSDKARVFNCCKKGSGAFAYVMAELKQFFMNLLESICDAKIEEGMSLRKFGIKHRAKHSKIKAKIYNEAIYIIERELNLALESINNTYDSFDERKEKNKAIKRIVEVQKKYYDILHVVRFFPHTSRGGRNKGKTHKMWISFSRHLTFDQVRSLANLLLKKFRADLERATGLKTDLQIGYAD